MPKLLQKNILRANLIFASLGILSAVGILYALNFNVAIGLIFNGINSYLFIVGSSNFNNDIFITSLPEYIFIAPYSRLNRQNFIQKEIKSKIMGAYICFFLPIICPAMVCSIINENFTETVICIVELLLITGLVYTGVYLNFFYKTKSGKYYLIQIIRFTQYVMFAGISTEMILVEPATSLLGILSNNIPFFLLAFIVTVPGLILSIVCRKKYFDEMIDYLADYEKSRELKNMKNK